MQTPGKPWLSHMYTMVHQHAGVTELGTVMMVSYGSTGSGDHITCLLSCMHPIPLSMSTSTPNVHDNLIMGLDNSLAVSGLLLEGVGNWAALGTVLAAQGST